MTKSRCAGRELLVDGARWYKSRYMAISSIKIRSEVRTNLLWLDGMGKKKSMENPAHGFDFCCCRFPEATEGRRRPGLHHLGQRNLLAGGSATASGLGQAVVFSELHGAHMALLRT